MTALGSVPNAHTQGEPEGTWNLEKLHLELKYLGRKLAEAKLQRGERAAGTDWSRGLAHSKFKSKYLSREDSRAAGSTTHRLHAKSQR